MKANKNFYLLLVMLSFLGGERAQGVTPRVSYDRLTDIVPSENEKNTLLVLDFDDTLVATIVFSDRDAIYDDIYGAAAIIKRWYDAGATIAIVTYNGACKHIEDVLFKFLGHDLMFAITERFIERTLFVKPDTWKRLDKIAAFFWRFVFIARKENSFTPKGEIIQGILGLNRGKKRFDKVIMVEDNPENLLSLPNPCSVPYSSESIPTQGIWVRHHEYLANALVEKSNDILARAKEGLPSLTDLDGMLAKKIKYLRTFEDIIEECPNIKDELQTFARQITREDSDTFPRSE